MDTKEVKAAAEKARLALLAALAEATEDVRTNRAAQALAYAQALASLEESRHTANRDSL